VKFDQSALCIDEYNKLLQATLVLSKPARDDTNITIVDHSSAGELCIV